MNKSILSSAAVSDVTFIGLPVSIIYPLALELRECGECQQLQGEREGLRLLDAVIHHHRLRGRPIYISEPYNGAARGFSYKVFVLKNGAVVCDE